MEPTSPTLIKNGFFIRSYRHKICPICKKNIAQNETLLIDGDYVRVCKKCYSEEHPETKTKTAFLR